MKINGKTALICDCEATMALDGKALAKACAAADGLTVHSHLCRTQLDAFRQACATGEPVMVACTQESPLFDEIAAEDGEAPPLSYVNVRERAGWSADGGAAATAKIAALLAEGALDAPDFPTVTLRSEGRCLVYGRDQTALDAASRLAARLDVTLLLSETDEVIPPRINSLPIFQGTIRNATGHLGAFELTIDGYAAMAVSSRGGLAFQPSRDGVTTTCDLILDLSGGTALFPAPEKRDGYVRPDPRNPAAVQRALFDLTELVGEFQKPRYVNFSADLCAHSRSRKTGCTRCLDVCPASAIAPDGDTVRIDPFICGGCGACHSVCPTGAASYALPPPDHLINRLRTLLTTYYGAGGAAAVLLIHDPRHGEDIITLMARYGGGLPANLLPFAVNEVTQVGLEFLTSAFAYGASRVVLLVPPARRDELTGLTAQIDICEALLAGLGYGQGRIEIVLAEDPDGAEQMLRALAPIAAPPPGTHLAMGDKRSLSRMAASRLHAVAPAPLDVLDLPAGAPFGAITVDADGCTLCLSCIGACPTGALLDNADKPQLSFVEDACVQCGLCKSTCPEQVISLVPRYDFTREAVMPRILKEEEPFACIRCGKPFGTKSSIDRVLTQLANKHTMFQTTKMVETIQMCPDCRIVVQFEDTTAPLAGAERPRIRTTEDYLAKGETAKH